MAKSYFITGTDTEVGKTFVTELLIRYWRGYKHEAVAIKPIASDSQIGTVADYHGLINEDSRRLYWANEQSLSYQEVNPICFAEAIAPHIAAAKQQQPLSLALLSKKLVIPNKPLVLIEGAGGWLTPLNERETYADWVSAHKIPVILVVGMKLGCLNHAQLTANAIARSGLQLSGWIANQVQPDMAYYHENLDWLKQNLKAPLLAEVAYQQSLEQFEAPELARLL